MNRFVQLLVVSIIIHGASVCALDSSRGAKHLVAQVVRRAHNPARFVLLQHPRDRRVNPHLREFLAVNGNGIAKQLLGLEKVEAAQAYAPVEKPELDIEKLKIAAVSEAVTKYGVRYRVMLLNGEEIAAEKIVRGFGGSVKRVTHFSSRGNTVFSPDDYDKIEKLYRERMAAKKRSKKS